MKLEYLRYCSKAERTSNSRSMALGWELEILNQMRGLLTGDSCTVDGVAPVPPRLLMEGAALRVSIGRDKLARLIGLG